MICLQMPEKKVRTGETGSDNSFISRSQQSCRLGPAEARGIFSICPVTSFSYSFICLVSDPHRYLQCFVEVVKYAKLFWTGCLKNLVLILCQRGEPTLLTFLIASCYLWISSMPVLCYPSPCPSLVTQWSCFWCTTVSPSSAFLLWCI